MRRYYLSVISGQRRGLGAALVRGLLRLGTLVYAALHGARRLLYAAGILRSVREGVFFEMRKMRKRSGVLK